LINAGWWLQTWCGGIRKVQFEEVCRNKILFLSFWDCGYFSGIMAVKEDLLKL
jgi:hypothetical protein